MTRNEFILQAILAQMSGHPRLGTDYMSTTCQQLVINAELLAKYAKPYFTTTDQLSSTPEDSRTASA
jgi:hypothetical protein